METVRTDLLREWKQEKLKDGVRLSYPVKDGARGFYPYGFVKKNDSAADWVDWYGLELALSVPDSGEAAVRLKATVSFADREPLSVELPALAQDHKILMEIPFSAFPVERVKGSYWQFVTSVSIRCDRIGAEVEECAAKRRRGLYLHAPVKGKSGRPGEKLIYEGELYNCTSKRLVVTAWQELEGWESMSAQIDIGGGTADKNEGIILNAGERIPVKTAVTVHENMAAGGQEAVTVCIHGQGEGMTCEERIVYKTLRYLPHPYLYHNRKGWEQVREKINSYAYYQEAYQEYLDASESWQVEDPMEGRGFCYETKTEQHIVSTAYLYAVTGEERYAKKLADFYRRFFNPITGYPARKKGCSQSYVQEGHFFKHLALGADIIWESGALSKKDKDDIENGFRIYMKILDTHILDGHISNWLLSELLGALFCALVIQDMDQAFRFAFGTGGIVEQFRHGVLNDGWWYECSVGYNTWVSSIILHTAHALLPFGYDLTHTAFAVPFNLEVDSSHTARPTAVRFGMYNQKWGGNRRAFVRIRDMFDAVLPYLDYRGVIFGIADSDEKKLSGVHFGSTYDLAYHYYKEPAYLHVIANTPPDPIFGEPEAYERALHSKQELESAYSKSACSDNIGIAMLRSEKSGRPPREQIQAVLRYGSHGYAHGHFDIADLLSVMRYGRSFFNPEHCWWGYAHFMYKFYVQNSLTKNMVVVDEKLQVPADSRKILWHIEPELKAVGVQVRTKWAYPPYGGMVYEQDGETNTKEDLRKRCKRNGCYLPIAEGEGAPEYGELTGYTEEICQKRIMAVTDDYIVLFDYLEGEQDHQYDSLMQIKGFQEISGKEVRKTRHTEQMNENPVSDAQFITDCQWYEVKDGSVARFCTVFTEEHTGEQLKCDRSNYNEPGLLYMDVHTAWPRQSEQMIGRVAVYEGWAAAGSGFTIPLAYRIEADKKTIESGEFDGWILGRGEIEADITGKNQIALILKQGCMRNEIGNEVQTPQGVFWGEVCLTLADGRTLNLGQCLQEENQEICPRIVMENVDTGYGAGKDYFNGRVTIVGNEYPYALGASPLDHNKESRIILNLDGLAAVKLTACVGVDAFPGDEWQKRKTYAVRSHGRTGRYITVIEPYEKASVIEEVTAETPDQVCIKKKDGSVQSITICHIQSDTPTISYQIHRFASALHPQT